MQHQTRRTFFKSKKKPASRRADRSGFTDVSGAASRQGHHIQTRTRTSRLPGLPHFAPKARRLIYLFMNGAPSQIDLWDHKPKFGEIFDADLPDSIRNGQRLTTMTSGQKRFPIAPSIYKFASHGTMRHDGQRTPSRTARSWMIWPSFAQVYTEAINHDPASTYILTGNQIPGKPSIGSWFSYGLGSLWQTCRRLW